MAKDLILTKAQNAVLAHDWATAASLYKELLRGNESNVEYLKELGSIYVKGGEDEKAIPYYEQIITFYPHYVEAMNSLGAIFRRLKRYEESVQILQRAKEESRDGASVNYNLGFTYKEMGNYEDAIEAFNSVITENPDDVLAYNHLGSIYFSQDDCQKSIAAYKRGLQVDPNHPILNYNLARVYEVVNNYPDAVRCYNAALKTRPGWIDAIQDFSGLLIKCQQTKAAQEMVEQSIKLHPMNTELLYILGKIYLLQYDYDNATHTLKKAASIKGDDIKILSALAEALEKGAKPDEALEKVMEAMDVEPDNKELRKQYAHTLLSAEKYDKAFENIKELDDENGENDPELLDLYGQYYICQGDDDAADEYFEKIKKLDNQYKDYLLSAADRHVQKGNYEKAEKFAREFIERRTRSPEGYAKLGKIYAANGKLQNARALYEKSITLAGGNVISNSEIKRLDAELQKSPSSDEIIQSILGPEIEEASRPVDPLLDDLPSEEVAAEAPAQTEEAAVVYEEAPSLHNLAENDGEFDAAVFGDDQPAAEESEEPPLPTAEELGIDELAKPEDSSFDFNQMGDSVPLTDELAEEADNDFWSEFDNADGEDSGDGPVEQSADGPAGIPADATGAVIASLLDNQRRTLDMADRQLQMTEDFIKETVKETVEKAVDEAVDKAVDEKLQNVLGDSPVAPPAPVSEEDEMALLDDDGFGDLDFEEDDLMDEEPFMEVDDFYDAEEDLGFDSVDEFAPADAEAEVEPAVEEAPAEEETEPESEPEPEVEAPEEVEEAVEEPEPEVEPEVSAAEESDEFIETLSEADEVLEEDNSLIRSVESADYMLDKIQKILNDTDLQAVSADKIELFKTLRTLLDYLPEGEKNNSITRRMNMLLAYLIDKLSGKPGLLATSESLIKSGVLGDEYYKQLVYEKSGEITNSLISKVLTDMKRLSDSLSDREIAKALCASADGILEQIELEDQKSRIF